MFAGKLLRVLMFPLFCSLLSGLAKALETGDAGIGFRVFGFSFLFLATVFIAMNFRGLSSLWRGNRL